MECRNVKGSNIIAEVKNLEVLMLQEGLAHKGVREIFKGSRDMLRRESVKPLGAHMGINKDEKGSRGYGIRKFEWYGLKW